MSKLNTLRRSSMPRLGLALTLGLVLLLGLLWATAAAQPSESYDVLTTQPSTSRNGSPDVVPVITDTASQYRVGISGDCVVYRQDDGVYLYNLTSGETFTITDQPDEIRKVAVSQGVVVWRSEREGEGGLWGYYHPGCSDAGPFTSTQVIAPFYIVCRANAHAQALAGEMLTFDTLDPKGAWYVALVELDADDNGIPDATEEGYDPTDKSIVTPISDPTWCGPNCVQRMSDITWDDDYKLACWYDNATGVEAIECNDLHHLHDPTPWIHRFTVVTSTWIPMVDFQGIVAVHRDLVVWTDARDYDVTGYDLYVADLDLDDDGILNHEDPTPGDGPAVFTLVNHPYNQAYPDIWWPFVVWADWRNGGQSDVYAYDLSLNSDGDAFYNWKDPNRHCIDPAEFRITFDPADQTTPELWSDTVVWEDVRDGNWDIYGASLEPRQPIPTASGERALYWLDQQTVYFDPVRAIPGHVAPTGMITRYKSFTQAGSEHVRRAWYSPTVGSYVVGYDYCHYGTPDQKLYLGRYGRGFIYDQGLALIARTMVSQPTQAKDLAGYGSSFQNSGQLTTTAPGSFGFSFNGQGNGGEKDNLYDMDYLRVGANAWMGYGLLFYTRQSGDTQFMDVITRVADYILDRQVISPTDLRHGLFTGGYGSWMTATDVFTDVNIEWVATEHNIDTYFFLRDLGLMTGERRYLDSANLLRANMPSLWNEEKGRLNQGMTVTNTQAGLSVALNTGDALDAASWGAIYWVAVGDLEKARQSLAYADATYSNTVTISPTLSVWGYKPYSGTAEGGDWSDVNVVWSEGSLGVAMAYLKLGHALRNQGDAEGDAYIQQARNVVTEMEKLQALDPNGGLLYAVSDGDGVPEFPHAPSAAGTTWLLMVQQAIQDEAVRDAFWGPDRLVYLPLILKNQ